MKDKILAFFCKICPFCIAARIFPNSKYAKKIKEIEKKCPACRAYENQLNKNSEKNK